MAKKTSWTNLYVPFWNTHRSHSTKQEDFVLWAKNCFSTSCRSDPLYIYIYISECGVFGHYRFPPFSDTYERSRRATAGKLLAISLRLFFVFKKTGISQKNPKYTSKNKCGFWKKVFPHCSNMYFSYSNMNMTKYTSKNKCGFWKKCFFLIANIEANRE